MSVRPHSLGLVVAALVGCGGPRTDRPPRPAADSAQPEGPTTTLLEHGRIGPVDEEEQRHASADSDEASSEVPSAGVQQGSPEPVAFEQGGEPDWRRRLISPKAVQAEGREVQLQGRRFVGTERFDIDGVPPGITVYRVTGRPPTWEFRNELGERVALLQEERWHRVLRPDLAPPRTAPVWAESAGRTIYLRDWGGAPARIRCEHILTPLRLYRVERRVEDTSFVVMGFRYKSTTYDPYDSY